MVPTPCEIRPSRMRTLIPTAASTSLPTKTTTPLSYSSRSGCSLLFGGPKNTNGFSSFFSSNVNSCTCLCSVWVSSWSALAFASPTLPIATAPAAASKHKQTCANLQDKMTAMTPRQHSVPAAMQIGQKPPLPILAFSTWDAQRTGFLSKIRRCVISER